MTARGGEFLNEWVSENVPPLPVTGDVLIRALAQKLRDDASAARASPLQTWKLRILSLSSSLELATHGIHALQAQVEQ